MASSWLVPGGPAEVMRQPGRGSEALQSPKLADFRFSIQGHADPRGNPEKNLQLSQHRAESVRDYLVTYKQIPNERLQAIGKGDTELMNRSNPIAPENRRVTIVNLARQP